jgi:phenylacetate-CoA ligase
MAFPFENRIWDQSETMAPRRLREAQLERLVKLVDSISEVPFYKEAFARLRVSAGAIKSLDDLRRLPFTTSEDLRQGYPLGFLAVPRREVARIHSSSGAAGKPTFVAYTAKDIDLWANLCARFLVAGGVCRSHTVHVAYDYGLFTWGLGLHYGVEKVGAAVVPAGPDDGPRQIMLMQALGAKVLACAPSHALQIAEVARRQGIDPASLPLKLAHLGGEPWTQDMRDQIERQLGLLAFNNYGLSEVIGPGVSGECVARTGMHIQEDHFIVECIDPDTLEPVPLGQKGELVFTSLTKQAMPIIRYRTRDIAVLDDSPCPCGRTTVRMGRVIGRSKEEGKP